MDEESQPLLKLNPHESTPPLVASLADAFALCKPQLKPPFSLSIPSPSQYNHLTLALAHAALTLPFPAAEPHLTHLHAAVTDGYHLFTSTLLSLARHHFPKLHPVPRSQLLSLAARLVSVSASKVDALLICLLRWIPAGDFSDPSLSLCAQLLEIFSQNWDWLVDEQPLLLKSAVFVFLRLLSDHYRLAAGGPNLDELKRSEILFCLKALRQRFGLCMEIGRDLVRLLQDVTFVPEFRELWRDLLTDPAKFGVPGFSDLSHLYRIKTPCHYFSLRISPEMETELRFLLTHVKWGLQRRYQCWFAKKHLSFPGSEAAIVDIVRFICCAHHPPNEIIQSDVLPRWAVIGWLLKCCRRNYFEANVKLALFYDWLFFDEKVDSLMNLEPAMLLMANSLPKYVDMTQTLLEFLFLLVDNYDVRRKEMIVKGVSVGFGVIVRKGVVRSLEVITGCGLISPPLRKRLSDFVPGANSAVAVKTSSGSCSRQMEVTGGIEGHVELSK